MFILGFTAVILALYLVLFWLVPKGWVLHELLYFPFFWIRHIATARKSMNEEKIAYGDHKHQYFLYFKPMVEPAKKRIVLYFHGGGWRYGRPRFFRLNAYFFASRGYHVVLPSHRHPPRFKYQDLREDLAKLFYKVNQMSLDNEWYDCKMILTGMSSGGHLATLSVYDPFILQHNHFSIDKFGGLLVCGAPLNFNLMPDVATIRDMAGPRSGELFQIANPLNHLKPGIRIPILCFHGEKDAIVPFYSIQPFVKELSSYHPAFTFHPIKNGNHYQALNWLYKKGKERKILEEWLEELSEP